jgi:hypothetical protein
MATLEAEKTGDLPSDNASRLAIYDVLCERTSATGAPGVTDDDLFGRVIGRLRMLVPRELHLIGERAFLDEKLHACVEAGVIAESAENGLRLLTLTGRAPLVRYPDGEVREYSPGLETARERLDRDNSRLRAAGFDVRKCFPSIADDPDGPQFQTLLASIREHGFMKQFPIAKYEDNVVLDGRARLRAAATLDVAVEYLKYGPGSKDSTIARRRDTPLNRVLVAVHSNAGRLTSDDIVTVHERVAEVTRRSWEETAADLALTEEWRRSIPGEYTPRFDVKKFAYREGEEARIQVTSDEKVMLRSLIEAGGLSNYKYELLRDYVPFEEARTVHSGRKAIFARAEDLVAGIGLMQQERRVAKRKVDPEWEQIRQWLVSRFMGAEA